MNGLEVPVDTNGVVKRAILALGMKNLKSSFSKISTSLVWVTASKSQSL
jgi:hypothetical protein